LQPARWPPEGGCAAGAASCQDPRAPTRLGRARCWTPEGVRQEGAGASPRGCAVAFITCCRRAVKLRSVASDPRVGGARPALVQGSRGSSSPRPSLGSRAPRGASAWARGFGASPRRSVALRRAAVAAPRGGAASAGFVALPEGRLTPPLLETAGAGFVALPEGRLTPPLPLACSAGSGLPRHRLSIADASNQRAWRSRQPKLVVPPGRARLLTPPPRWWGRRRRRGGSGESVPASRDRRIGRHRGAAAAGRSLWPPWLRGPETLLLRPMVPVLCKQPKLLPSIGVTFPTRAEARAVGVR